MNSASDGAFCPYIMAGSFHCALAGKDQTRFGQFGRGWHVMFTAVGPRAVTRLGDMTACSVSGLMFLYIVKEGMSTTGRVPYVCSVV